MTVAKRGALSAVAAILVHVTVIRATTAMPRPFNDFYPLANVPHKEDEDKDKDEDEEEEEEEEEEENEGRIEKENENVSIVPSSLFLRNSNEPKTSFLQPPPPLLLSPSPHPLSSFVGIYSSFVVVKELIYVTYVKGTRSMRNSVSDCHDFLHS
ncbi:hypothetical protein V1477_008281 [Vespula maculifrons]|uniref:Transmembrane protein n=1 Tax=Vespula maculifrons TaxID=7453 RepID=A0ABD2CCL0_VESMC